MGFPVRLADPKPLEEKSKFAEELKALIELHGLDGRLDVSSETLTDTTLSAFKLIHKLKNDRPPVKFLLIAEEQPAITGR